MQGVYDPKVQVADYAWGPGLGKPTISGTSELFLKIIGTKMISIYVSWKVAVSESRLWMPVKHWRQRICLVEAIQVYYSK